MKSERDVKAFAAVSVLPNSTYAVNVTTATMTGMVLSRNAYKEATIADFHRMLSSWFLTPCILSQKDPCGDKRSACVMR